MLRRVLAATGVLGALFVAPITLSQPDSGLPTVMLNDVSCSTDDEAKCCAEMKSICLGGDEIVINYRAAGGSPCGPN